MMEIIIGDRMRRMDLTLEKVMNSDLKYYFFNYKKEKKPELKKGKLFVNNDKVDMFFLVKLREQAAMLAGLQNDDDCNVILDVNGEYIRID